MEAGRVFRFPFGVDAQMVLLSRGGRVYVHRKDLCGKCRLGLSPFCSLGALDCVENAVTSPGLQSTAKWHATSTRMLPVWVLTARWCRGCSADTR